MARPMRRAAPVTSTTGRDGMASYNAAMQHNEGDSVSAALRRRIHEAIAAGGGWIAFDRFMAMALYEPGLSCAPFPGPLRAQPDRCQRGTWFLKRKFLSVGHAKNFLAGAMADQAVWFDELAGRSLFPQTYAAALLVTVPLVFGALISPTDPIAVIGILKSANAPKNVNLVVSGESLFNDGVGIVLFMTFAAGAAGAGTPSVGAVTTGFGRLSHLNNPYAISATARPMSSAQTSRQVRTGSSSGLRTS